MRALGSAPNPPIDIAYSSLSDTSVTVNWTPRALDETAITVNYKKSSDPTYTSDVIGPGLTQHSLTGLDPSTSYDIQVIYTNLSGDSLPLPGLVVTTA
jgi:hypothetical protein